MAAQSSTGLASAMSGPVATVAIEMPARGPISAATMWAMPPTLPFWLALTATVAVVGLLALAAPDLDDDAREQARSAGIAIEEVPVSSFDFDADDVGLTLDDGRTLRVDTLYAALGSRTRNDLGEALGTELSGNQCFVTDAHQRCSVPGVYAAGDAVEGLDQISCAMGTAARAAVAIHNDLRKADGEVLQD